MYPHVDTPQGVSDPMLARALALAVNGRGATSPNPMVGCVIVNDDRVVGEGFHARAGGPHAEVVALKAAGAAARGGTAYVTLEPCNHYGKTPPCTSALLAAGVSAVVIGMADPNTEVSGGGAAALREQGVDVRFAADDSPFRALNEAWLKRLETGLPFVSVKLALTLDGRAVLTRGLRSRITGSGGAAFTRRLRAASTAVAVGAATVGVDDPMLTVRGEGGHLADRQPVRVVISRTSVPVADRRVFSVEAATMLVVSDRAAEKSTVALERGGCQVVRYSYEDGVIGALKAVASAGIDDVLVEAGPSLLSALWDANVIDVLYVVQAGGMGGNAAPPLYLGHADRMGADLAAKMRAVDAFVEGDDAVVVWRPHGM